MSHKTGHETKKDFAQGNSSNGSRNGSVVNSISGSNDEVLGILNSDSGGIVDSSNEVEGSNAVQVSDSVNSKSFELRGSGDKTSIEVLGIVEIGNKNDDDKTKNVSFRVAVTNESDNLKGVDLSSVKEFLDGGSGDDTPQEFAVSDVLIGDNRKSRRRLIRWRIWR